MRQVEFTPAENETLQNATSSFASMEGLIGLILIVFIAIVVVGLLAGISPGLARNRILERVAKALARFFNYVIKGVGVALALSVIIGPFYWLATLEPSTQELALEVITFVVVGLAFFAALGYLGEYAVSRYIDAHPELEEFWDIFPEPEPEAEVAD